MMMTVISMMMTMSHRQSRRTLSQIQGIKLIKVDIILSTHNPFYCGSLQFDLIYYKLQGISPSTQAVHPKIFSSRF
jgi:hypothetical protein